MSQNTNDFSDLDRQRLRLLRHLGLKIDYFFDIGASNGSWSRMVSEDFPDARFEMFEPLSEHVPDYLEEMATLLTHGPRFRLHKCALGAENRRIQMHILSNPYGSTALKMEHYPEDSKCVEVEMLTIDQAMEKWNLPTPNVIKMDTQGFELNILKGAQQTLPKVDVLLCETWLTRGYGPETPLLLEVANWLRNFGFYLWDFCDVYRDERGVLIAPDCIFLNARSGISQLGDELNRLPAPML